MENGYEKELKEEFGHGDSPLGGLSFYLTNVLKKASVAIEFLIESYEEDSWQSCEGINDPDEDNKKVHEKEKMLFFCLECISKRINYKFNSAQEGYEHFCKLEDEKYSFRSYKKPEEEEDANPES
jgi:hypothetical protein